MPRKPNKRFTFEFTCTQYGKAHPDVHQDFCVVTPEVKAGVEAHDTYLVSIFDGDTSIYRGGASLTALERFCANQCQPPEVPLPNEAQELLNKLEALITLGIPVPIKAEGLRKLAHMGSLGRNILTKAVAVLQEKNPKKRYWPLMDLLMEQRAIAEQCFPEAPSTVPEHMQYAPEWLEESPTLAAAK